MENIENIEQAEQNNVEPGVSPVEAKKSWMPSTRTLIIIAVVIAVGVLAYMYRGLFIVATVNGSPISRFTLIGKLEEASGKQILDQLITKKLIMSELDNKKISITDEELSVEIKKIEDQVAGQGGTLDQALEAQGMTMADLQEQISINLRLEKFFSDQIQVSDEEVGKYLKDNKLKAPKGQEAQFNEQVRDQIKSGKLSQVAQDWISSIRTQASINYFVNY